MNIQILSKNKNNKIIQLIKKDNIIFEIIETYNNETTKIISRTTNEEEARKTFLNY